MGSCCSTAKAPDVVFTDVSKSDLEAKMYDGPLLVRLLQADNVPVLDIDSESDVFVRAELVDAEQGEIGKALWPVKWDAINPIWDSARLFGKEPPAPNAMLRLHFYDKDETNADDYIGTAETKVARIGAEENTTLPIALHQRAAKRASSQPSTVTLRREPVAPYVGKRVVLYLVRHGESVWNEAQSSMRVDVMLSDVDHPLNATGRAQAESLRSHLAAGSAHALEMSAADSIMCSPLTRAVQTCLIGLEPLLLSSGAQADGGGSVDGAGAAGAASHRPVALNPNLREKRNAGGMDSSGKWVGTELTAGVHAQLTSLYADAPDRAKALAQVPLDLSHVGSKWWLGSKEGNEHVMDRIRELLFQLRFSTPNSQILVGHSHYFRELFRHFAAPSCTLSDAAGSPLPVGDMASKKLSNAGVARCVCDFDAAGGEKPIVEVQLLFETQLVD